MRSKHNWMRRQVYFLLLKLLIFGIFDLLPTGKWTEPKQKTDERPPSKLRSARSVCLKKNEQWSTMVN